VKLFDATRIGPAAAATPGSAKAPTASTTETISEHTPMRVLGSFTRLLGVGDGVASNPTAVRRCEAQNPQSATAGQRQMGRLAITVGAGFLGCFASRL
jgi:hypothetical protein